LANIVGGLEENRQTRSAEMAKLGVTEGSKAREFESTNAIAKGTLGVQQGELGVQQGTLALSKDAFKRNVPSQLRNKINSELGTGEKIGKGIINSWWGDPANKDVAKALGF
jgi:hypothetical protein